MDIENEEDDDFGDDSDGKNNDIISNKDMMRVARKEEIRWIIVTVRRTKLILMPLLCRIMFWMIGKAWMTMMMTWKMMVMMVMKII